MERMSIHKETVQFKIHFVTKPGEVICIAGTFSKGEEKWKPIEMKWTEGHIWTITLDLTSPFFFYKYVHKKPNETIWEKGMDRIGEVRLMLKIKDED